MSASKSNENLRINRISAKAVPIYKSTIDEIKEMTKAENWDHRHHNQPWFYRLKIIY